MTGDNCKSRNWEFWIDRGGTFTDIVAWHGAREILRTAKVLSADPGSQRNPVFAAIAAVVQEDGVLDPAELNAVSIRMGTTVATNALLTRSGDPTVVVITEGLGDLLLIGNQTRPRLFEFDIERPAPLWSRVIEVRERIDVDGEIITPLDEVGVTTALRKARESGASACAISLLHGWQYPGHECRIRDIARELGFESVVTSHRACPLRGLLARSETTIVDASLTPPLQRSGQEVIDSMPHAHVQLMQSNGGLVEPDAFVGSRAILSGPAGGMVGAVEVARQAGVKKVITFDMGGTSTDVAWYDGSLERRWDSCVDGLHLRVPMLDIDTIAAGGGSRCDFDGKRLRVGPGSAGASPGPACYRRQGPATITDCHVVLGRLDAELLPRVFGPGGNLPIDSAASRTAFDQLAEKMPPHERLPIEALASGCLDIAVERMASAIRRISVEKGRALKEATLVAFGGAGGQTACRVAEVLGIDQVLIHPQAGVLSALGMGLARLRRSRETTMDCAVEGEATYRATLDAMERDLKQELKRQGAEETNVRVTRRLHLQVRGWDGSISIPESSPQKMRRLFIQSAEARYGFRLDDNVDIQVDMAEVEVESADSPPVPLSRSPVETAESDAPQRVTRMWSAGAWHDVAVWSRDALPASAEVCGPAIIAEHGATTIVESGWILTRTDQGNLILRHQAQPQKTDASLRQANAIELEIFGHRFMSIAENMGATLRRTAHSVNIKERLDFSCAIFDDRGQLVANGPHMPVHLGSMDHSVRAVLEGYGHDLRPGDAWLLNDPYRGGTHLPDLTVVTPVFAAGSQRRLFFVASRGHHADIGGRTPGSMPAGASTLEEEGIVIAPCRIVRDGCLDESRLQMLLSSGRWPARNPHQNLADLRAQLAANTRGAGDLLELVEKFGESVVRQRMQDVLDHGAFCVDRLIGSLKEGTFTTPLDHGGVIQLAVSHRDRGIHFDFSGTSCQRSDNFNAPPAVTRAAVLYVLRCLIDDDIPLNAGCLRPVGMTLPPGSLLNPEAPAAVAAGNVETSQCVVDTVLAALQIQAASQGTMNNITFGDAERQYYETLCGGVGAGQSFSGADAVHVHMTNSRLTDPEILEQRFPVRLTRFQIRSGSGGPGRHRGGHGVIRELEFLQPTTLTLLAGRRRRAPFGLLGGHSGKVGEQEVIRANGQREQAAGCITVDLGPGDRFRIATPGGGGFGAPESPGM